MLSEFIVYIISLIYLKKTSVISIIFSIIGKAMEVRTDALSRELLNMKEDNNGDFIWKSKGRALTLWGSF